MRGIVDLELVGVLSSNQRKLHKNEEQLPHLNRGDLRVLTMLVLVSVEPEQASST